MLVQRQCTNDAQCTCVLAGAVLQLETHVLASAQLLPAGLPGDASRAPLHSHSLSAISGLELFMAWR